MRVNTCATGVDATNYAHLTHRVICEQPVEPYRMTHIYHICADDVWNTTIIRLRSVSETMVRASPTHYAESKGGHTKVEIFPTDGWMNRRTMSRPSIQSHLHQKNKAHEPTLL